MNSKYINLFLEKNPVFLQISKFICIGVLNTAIDFVVLNFLSKMIGVSAGKSLGYINFVGFSIAVAQSFFWNKSWAFASGFQSFWVEFKRLFVLGFLGGLTFLLTLISARLSAPFEVYGFLLLTFLILEYIFFSGFGLSFENFKKFDTEIWKFFVVSFIGFGINSLIIVIMSQKFSMIDSGDLAKNYAKILATVVSLIWNFLGYKLFVFKK